MKHLGITNDLLYFDLRKLELERLWTKKAYTLYSINIEKLDIYSRDFVILY